MIIRDFRKIPVTDTSRDEEKRIDKSAFQERIGLTLTSEDSRERTKLTYRQAEKRG